jgi:hypothetical protein
MPKLNRTVLVIGGLALAAVLAIGFTLASPARRAAAPPPPRPEPLAGGDVAALAAAPHLLFRHAGLGANARRLSLASIENPDAPFGVTDLKCDRIAYAAGRGICLRETDGLVSTFEAVLFDSAFRPGATVKLDGTPSRTRISADGRFGAITVFLTGQAHGYASASFSTKTTLLDMNSGTVLGDLEQFQTWRDGQKFSAADFNFWGVTFARDSNTFYASLWSAKKTYLVRGDVTARSLTVLRENVECPSLSPDNRRVAFKKRVGGDLAPWRLYVLDLASMQEHPIAAETRSIDDQVEWFDDSRVLYGASRGSQSAVTDVWIAPVDGNQSARAFLLQAASPIVVR